MKNYNSFLIFLLCFFAAICAVLEFYIKKNSNSIQFGLLNLEGLQLIFLVFFIGLRIFQKNEFLAENGTLKVFAIVNIAVGILSITLIKWQFDFVFYTLIQSVCIIINICYAVSKINREDIKEIKEICFISFKKIKIRS